MPVAKVKDMRGPVCVLQGVLETSAALSGGKRCLAGSLKLPVEEAACVCWSAGKAGPAAPTSCVCM